MVEVDVIEVVVFPTLLSVEPKAQRLSAVLHAAAGLGCLLLLAYLVSEDRRRISWRTVSAASDADRLRAAVDRRAWRRPGDVSAAQRRVDALQAATDRDAVRFRLSRRRGPAVRGNPSRRQLHPRLPGAAAGADDQRARLAAVLLGHVAADVTAAFAWLLRRAMGIGGPLALGAAVHVFVGMVEAPLLVRPYLARMQRGELFALMTCGMAGVAGTVMVIYASFLAPVVPERAGQHPDRLDHQHAGRRWPSPR